MTSFGWARFYRIAPAHVNAHFTGIQAPLQANIMATVLPLRLFHNIEKSFYVIDTFSTMIRSYDIVSYTWGMETKPYNCGINGVDWDVTISSQRIEDVQRLMINAEVEYLWVDCLCINQTDAREKATEISKMYEYFISARKCHILLDMDEVWNPQEIVDDLTFIDPYCTTRPGDSLRQAMGLPQNVINHLSMWATREWTFGLPEELVQSTSIDIGVLNCYSTSIGKVKSLFNNPYFFRMWTFQEMILGKNITVWGINADRMSFIGVLDRWMDLATHATDKAYKLQRWIDKSFIMKPAAVTAILSIIQNDMLSLGSLKTQVRGIYSARSDIIMGGPSWWTGNPKGVSNIFSAVSITPRRCAYRVDIFRGLLGIFSGLFTEEQIQKEMMGDDMDKISFSFFKQLSIKTGIAWTKLAISRGERKELDWIPLVKNHDGEMSTDYLAGIVDLGVLNQKNQATPMAMTGINGVPKKYMTILIRRDNRGFQFIFKGCNCGKAVKTGVFSSEKIPTYDKPRHVVKDETGSILVQCASILGSIMDPSGDVIEYRRRLLHNLQPIWNISDPCAKPAMWEDRCVSGTAWEQCRDLRAHNMSMNYQMLDVIGCESRSRMRAGRECRAKSA
jgi:hypothetical protein